MPRPRWGRLYAILAVGDAAIALLELYAKPPALVATLRYTIAGLVWGSMIWWVRAHRVALDMEAWCACATRSVRVRVVPSRLPQDRSDPETPLAVPAEIDSDTEIPLIALPR